MSANLSPKELINFIQGDFEFAWNLLAENPQPGHRGNFMFARQAMILLEVAGRICRSDQTGTAIKTLSDKLAALDRRYFTVLPIGCESKAKYIREFQLPSLGPMPERQLLPILFDLIRNGQAHQYQQICVSLQRGFNFGITLTGADHGRYLTKTLAANRPAEHLGVLKDSSGDVWLKVLTDMLFLDIRDSIREAKLLDQELKFDYLGRRWKCERSDLEVALSTAGHQQLSG